MKSTPQFTRRYFSKLPGWILLLLILFILSLSGLFFITHNVFLENEKQLDHRVFHYMSAHVIKPDLTLFMKEVTYFASARFMQIVFGSLALLYILLKDYKRSGEIAVIGIGGFLINFFLKLFFQRVRPPHPLIEPLTNFSFPSGHATSGFIFYGLLVYLIWKSSMPKALKYFAAFLFPAFALLIGFSRIYLRLHYTTDVIAGFCIGLAWLSLSIWMMERLKKKAEKELQEKNVATADNKNI
jgi:membrane-associated phospholipid phosphatase